MIELTGSDFSQIETVSLPILQLYGVIYEVNFIFWLFLRTSLGIYIFH